MAERGRWPKFLLTALAALAALAAVAAAWLWLRPRVDPIPFSGPTEAPASREESGGPNLDPTPYSGPAEDRFLGSVGFSLPAGFQAASGRLQLLCQGPPGLTRVLEVPRQPSAPAVQLAALVPDESPPLSLVEAEADFGRPALWAICPGGPDEVLAHLVLDFQGGAVVLSRPLPAARLEEGKLAFTAEARRFAEEYSWGHEGAGPEERHSLHGRLKLNQTCRRFRGNVKFTSPEAVLEVFWPGSPLPAAWPGEPDNLHRPVRSGPRLLDGRPGREQVTLADAPGDAPGEAPGTPGEAALAAVWRPEAEEEAAFFLSAAAPSAALALGYWDSIMDSVHFIGSAPENVPADEPAVEDGPAYVSTLAGEDQEPKEPDRADDVQAAPAKAPDGRESAPAPAPAPKTTEDVQAAPAKAPDGRESAPAPAPAPKTTEDVQAAPAKAPDDRESSPAPAPAPKTTEDGRAAPAKAPDGRESAPAPAPAPKTTEDVQAAPAKAPDGRESAPAPAPAPKTKEDGRAAREAAREREETDKEMEDLWGTLGVAEE